MAALIARANPYLSIARLGLARAAREDRERRRPRAPGTRALAPARRSALRDRGFPARVVVSRRAHRDEPRRRSRARRRSGSEAEGLWAEHRAERAKRAEFYARQEARNAAARADRSKPDMRVQARLHRQAHVLDQILTSLRDRVHRVPARDARRGAARHRRGLSRDDQRRDQPARAALQARVAARVAARSSRWS